MTETQLSRPGALALLATEELPTLPISPEQRRLATDRALTRTEPYDLCTGVFAQLTRTGDPNAVAVRDQHRSLTYAELADAARRMATLLAETGIGAGDVVAVGGPRSAEVLVAFLAIELAGAVYLPVDQEWPAKRVDDVLRRSGAAALVVADATGLVRPALLDVTACPVLLATAAAHRPPSAVGAPHHLGDELAYLLYTSGSTGAPKGAVVEHRGMLNHLLCKVTDLGLTAADRIAQTAPLVFDISLWQLLCPLLVGGQVHILPDELAQNPSLLLPAVRDREITVLELVPTLLRLFLDEVARGQARPALRWLLATGEELPPETATRFAALLPDVELMNAYGPTECSDDVTHFVVGPPAPEVRHLPIGGPVANTDLYVLRREDDSWLSCPVGETGELFVGGAGVGRGYHGDPVRTREAFFQDPFSSTVTGRLYRTGDAVVDLGDGTVEYRGRVDRQLKIAGFRMEPAEIEAVLAQFPGVAACAVTTPKPSSPNSLVARETKVDGSGERRLCAYICPANETVDTAALRDYLAERLPLPMVPRHYVVLREMPLTRNGKVDYPALTELAVPAGDPTAYEAPRDAAEEAVATAMADLLDVARVGRDDSFLGLGGDSLLAVSLIARLRAAGYAVSMRDILVGGTPAEVASRTRPFNSLDEAVPTTGGRRPLTPQQSGVYFHWKLAPDNPYYNYQGSIRLTGKVDQARLAAAWQALLVENPMLVARFLDGETPEHEYPYWQLPLGEPVDLSEVHDRERRYRADAYAEAAAPFDLLGEPVLRVRHYRMTPTEHRLLLTTHEIMLDGWGTTVLCRRLAQLYSDPTAARPGTYDRYLDWQSDRQHTPEFRTAGEYWRSQLDGPLPVLDLPAETARPAHPSYRGGIVEDLVNVATTQRIRRLGAELGVTPFMMFLAAYALALGYYSGADEVVVGAPVANREQPEQIDVPAFLLNMLPLRVAVDPDTSGMAYLKAVRDTVVAGFGASEYPFGWMLRDLPGSARNLASTPVFQTMLNVITYPAERLQARDVTFAFTEMESGFVKYDCSLFVQAHGPDQMLAQLDYHLDVLTEDTAQRILESTMVALTELAEHPDVLLRDIDLMPAADRVVLEGFAYGH
jgi:amino acid adenylation domain-containing protein